MMRARLEVLQGAKSKSMVLRLPTVIGRGGDARLKLPASTVSRHHCELYEYEGQIVVRDLESSNGTKVNGHRITAPTFLTERDELTVGPVTMRLSAHDDSIAKPAAKPLPENPEASLPILDSLPEVEDVYPMSATATDVAAIPADPGEESVLHYAEPQATGRSFLGIDAASEDEHNSPRHGLEGPSEDPMEAPDDRALRDFLDNLDG